MGVSQQEQYACVEVIAPLMHPYGEIVCMCVGVLTAAVYACVYACVAALVNIGTAAAVFKLPCLLESACLWSMNTVCVGVGECCVPWLLCLSCLRNRMVAC